ncbi:MAG: 50S ribosome-binding GTPase [Mollicutes bacterium UO1]
MNINKQTILILINKMTEKRVIIIIGKTGNGKSALANVLLNKNGEFEEIFEENNSFKSCTREFKSGNFEDEKRRIKYTVIDTPGISDTNPENEREVYRQIAKAVCSTGKKLNQVLFVTNNRFTSEEERAYELLWDAFFSEDITNFTTIVRTNFPNFEDSEACKKILRK